MPAGGGPVVGRIRVVSWVFTILTVAFDRCGGDRELIAVVYAAAVVSLNWFNG